MKGGQGSAGGGVLQPPVTAWVFVKESARKESSLDVVMAVSLVVKPLFNLRVSMNQQLS